MISRRSLLASALTAMMAAPALAKAKLGEDGLYQEDWYLQSFLDLAEDLTNASHGGKRFAILWGLRNCPACRRMHEVHLADPAIEGYIRDNFAVLHLNILGAREVTDFDGGKLSEKALAKRYGIEGTPAIQFFPTSASGLAAKPPQEREVARMASLPEPQAFLAQFRAVRNGV
jgi:thioredoxin-related protein